MKWHWCVGALIPLAAAAGACHAGDPAAPGGSGAAAGGAAPTLTLTSVAWNAANADVGQVAAVTEDGASFAIFGSTGVTMFTGGAPVGADESITTWKSAATIPAADGSGTWIVGVGGDGHLHWLSDASTLLDVSDRFGLLDAKVSDLAAVITADAKQSPPIGFLLDTGVAVSDGKNIVRYDGAEHAIAAGNGSIAIASDNVIRVLDAQGHETDTSLPDATYVTFDAKGTVLAATHHALFAIDAGTPSTPPRQIFDGGARTIHGMVTSAANTWIAIDADLGLYQGPGSMALSTGQAFANDARLFASMTGDVWVVSSGALTRYSGKTSNDDQGVWTTTVQPIYAGVCSNCHSPAGSGKDSSGIDLSTYDAWVSRKPAVLERVVTLAGTARAMPPLGSSYTITDDQRAAIGNWASH